jgi:hypothetical protein
MPSVLQEDKEKILFTTVPSALEILDFVWNHVLDSFISDDSVFL